MHLLDGLRKANLRGAPKPLVHGSLDPSLDKKQAELERDRRHAQAAAAERAQEGRTLQHHLFGGTQLGLGISPRSRLYLPISPATTCRPAAPSSASISRLYLA